MENKLLVNLTSPNTKQWHALVEGRERWEVVGTWPGIMGTNTWEWDPSVWVLPFWAGKASCLPSPLPSGPPSLRSRFNSFGRLGSTGFVSLSCCTCRDQAQAPFVWPYYPFSHFLTFLFAILIPHFLCLAPLLSKQPALATFSWMVPVLLDPYPDLIFLMLLSRGNNNNNNNNSTATIIIMMLLLWYNNWYWWYYYCCCYYSLRGHCGYGYLRSICFPWGPQYSPVIICEVLIPP